MFCNRLEGRSIQISQIRAFRMTALAESSSFLVLLFVAMPMKYLMGMTRVVTEPCFCPILAGWPSYGPNINETTDFHSMPFLHLFSCWTIHVRQTSSRERSRHKLIESHEPQSCTCEIACCTRTSGQRFRPPEPNGCLNPASACAQNPARA